MATYNVAEYIEESLLSVVNQSMREIEIICIDDASTDGTAEIIKRYADQDARITLLVKPKNNGLSVSRNMAVGMAKGEYLMFVDGDDLIDLDLVRKAYNCAQNDQAALVIWDYAIFWTKEELERNKRTVSTLCGLDISDKVTLLKRPSFSCVKMIKTEVLRSLQTPFPIGLTRQDIPVNWKILTHINRISLLPERLYFYRQQLQATTHRKDARLFDLATVMDLVRLQLVADGLYEQYKGEYLRQQLGLLYGMQDSIQKNLLNESIKRIRNRLTKEHWEYINSDRCALRWQAKSFYQALQGDMISKIKLKSWLFLRSLYRKWIGIIRVESGNK